MDLRRQEFGKWTVMHQGQRTAHGQFWVCYCACNPPVTVELVAAALLEGWTCSCGCDFVDSHGRRNARKDLVGQQVGQRLVLRFLSGQGGKRPTYLCRCTCGRETPVTTGAMATQKRGRCQSCAQSNLLPSRWYGQVFVEKTLGPGRSGHVMYQCRFQDGSVHRVDGNDIRKGTTKGRGYHPHRGRLAEQTEVLLGLIRAGTSIRGIARELGVTPGSAQEYFRNHPELHALVKTVPKSPVARNTATVMAMLQAGQSPYAIAGALGLSPNSVRHYLQRHPELRALAASLPGDEVLGGE